MAADRFRYPQNLDLVIRQRATFAYALQWVTTADGASMIAAGSTARMEVRATPSADTVKLLLTTENGSITLNSSTGFIHLNLTVDQTEVLRVGPFGVYDLLIIAPGGEPTTALVAGTVTVEAGVTVT